MATANVTKARAHLSALIRQALAGEMVTIGRRGRPEVRLVPCQPRRPRRPGALRGQIHIAADFDDLPDDLAQALGACPTSCPPAPGRGPDHPALP